jgi:hypothetical protein
MADLPIAACLPNGCFALCQRMAKQSAAMIFCGPLQTITTDYRGGPETIAPPPFLDYPGITPVLPFCADPGLAQTSELTPAMSDSYSRARARQAFTHAARTRTDALQAYALHARQRCLALSLQTRKRLLLNWMLLHHIAV